MPGSDTTDAAVLCVVTDDDVIRRAVERSCSPPCNVAFFSLEGILNAQHQLSVHGWAVVEAAVSSDAVLIDWSLEKAPAINTLCHHIRQGVLAPVIGLCRDGQEEQVAALAAGADDAMSVPLSLPFLQAKVLAYRRLVHAAQLAERMGGDGPDAAQGEPSDHDASCFGVLRLDRTAHRFFVRDEEVELTPREFALLEFLIAHAEALCTRDQILNHVWGITFDTGTNMVDVYMYFLRRKLEAHGLTGMIQTVRGRGYRLVLPGTPGLRDADKEGQA